MVDVSSIADDAFLSALTPTIVTLGLFLIAAAVWPKPTTIGRPVMIAISLAFMADYAWWRVTATLPSPGLTFEYAIALGFLFAEMGGALAAALSLVFLCRTRDRSSDADANAQWLEQESKYPPIDVLICSYNEEQTILERTIVGAQAMDYPNFRVSLTAARLRQVSPAPLRHGRSRVPPRRRTAIRR
jgi:cellulose synthase (UDP-forming)